MKAITCSQCGALIGDVSVNQKFTKCDYCGAKFRLQPEKVFEISRKEAVTINASFQKTPKPQFKALSETNSSIIPIFFFVFLPIAIVATGFYFNLDSDFSFAKKKVSVDVKMTAMTQIKGMKINSIKINPNNPESINSDSIDIDMPKIEPLNFDKTGFPQFAESEFPNMNGDELIETVFEERRINVKVKVDNKGNVTEAKAENGHKYLKRISEEAALKTSFFPPVNPNVTVIYMFSVKKNE